MLPGRPGRAPLRYAPPVRVAVLSDIHANVAALDAVLAVIPSVDEVWQLGDVVGYGPEPDAVVGRLREIGARGVRGNHDAAAVGELDIEAFNADARQAMEWTQAHDRRRDARRGSRPCPSGSSARTSCSSTAARAIRPGSTSPPPRSPGRASPPCRRTGGLHGHTHVPIAFVEDDGRLET